jgi:hypothetical protein
VPEVGLACSVACALKIPLKMREGRIDPGRRPMPGEQWTFMGFDVSITTVDPEGRWFNYIRPEDPRRSLKFGSIGAGDIDRSAFRKGAGPAAPPQG